MPGGGRKPWPQKRTGRSHVGTIRTPQFIRGGFAHGVRGPKTWFYMLPDTIRIQGLCTALTIKHTQDDLVLVDDFSSLPTSDPNYLQELADARNWGYSVLFVDTSAELVPQNLIKATEEVPSFNVMPLYGLNCYSIVKHETLVISRRALDALEERILEQLHKMGPKNPKYRYIDIKQTIQAEGQHEEHPIYPPSV
uniref:Large ribosomal subunit protein uL4m n=1 Tax=Ditylenchus dipsaci TaxID=166011 RepID=A0A915E1R9_9BILA